MNKKSWDKGFFVFVGILFCIWGISTCILTYILILGYPSFIGWGVFISLFIPTLIFYFERLDNEQKLEIERREIEILNRKGNEN